MADKENDKILNDLYAQQIELQYKLRERHKEIAKQEGKIFESIDELVCDKHKGDHFKVIGKIPGSWNFITKKKLNIYACEICRPKDLDKNLFNLKFFNMMPISKAYDCQDCGIVKAEIHVVPYSSPQEEWIALAGREGDHFHCSVCDTKLGEHYWKFS